jgi:hypothetical protein
VPVLLAILDRRLRLAAALFVVLASAFVVPLFVIWKGLVPPALQFVQQGLSITNGMTSLGYTGICFLLLLAPQTRWLPGKAMLAVVAVTAAINAILGILVLFPIRSAMDQIIPVGAMPAYGNLCGSLFLSIGVAWLALLARTMYEGRADLKLVAVNAGLLMVAISPMFVAHQYSSRYTGMALPYLLLASHGGEWTWKTVTTAALGCGAGFVSLFGYFPR